MAVTRGDQVRVTPVDINGKPTGDPVVLNCPEGHFAVERWVNDPEGGEQTYYPPRPYRL